MEENNIIKGSHLAKILRHGSLYMLSSFLVKGGNVLLLPIYTRYLDPSEYAVFSNLMAIGAIAAILISFYLDRAYARLFFDASHDPNQLRQLFSTIFLFSIAWGLIATVVIFFVIRNYTSSLLHVPWYPHILLACVIPLVTQINALAEVHFRSQHKSAIVTGAKFVGFAVGVIVSIVLLTSLRLGPVSLLYGALVRACVIWVWYYTRLFRQGLIGLTFSFGYFSNSFMYSLGLLPLAASGWIAGQLDKLLITWFGSLEESGIYSVAFEVGRIMSLFVRSLFMVYTPMIYAMLKEDAKKNVARIEQFQSFFLHALIGIAFFVSIFCPEIFQLFVHEKYHQGVGLVPVIAFALVFGGIRKLYANLIFYHKLTLFISIGGIIQALLGFGLNVLLIPRFGGQGAAWARFVSTFVVAVYFYLLSRKYEPLRVDRAALKATISIFIGCLAILLFCVYVLKLTFWPLLTAKVMIFFLAVVLTWFSRFGDELRRVLSKRKRKDTVSDEQIESTYDSISESQEI